MTGRSRVAGLLAVLLGLSGCASLSRPDADAWQGADPELSACATWMEALDQAVAAAGVRDAQEVRLRGFPHLRASRLSDALRTQASRGPAAMADWVGLLQRQGRAGQTVELANLPAPVLTRWMAVADGELAREQARRRLNDCSDRLAAAVLAEPDLQAQLLAADPVPDAYSTAARWAGVYPLSRLPFSWGVQRWQAGTLETFARESVRARTDEPFRRYTPSAAAQVGNPSLEQALQRTPTDALGLPRLDPALARALLDRHAPVFEIRHRADHDRPGRIVWGADGWPTVQPEQPVVYRRIAFTRLGGETLVQLVYLIWFSERPRTGPLDLLGGRLDGVVWRVTLDAQGRPLLYDSIHACGCYHLFFPDRRLREKPLPEPGIEWVFSPGPLVHPGPGERVVLRLDSATHYLMALGVSSDMEGIAYTFDDEDALRSLPWPPGGAQARRSLYGPDGMVGGTERGERWLFWPMGVRNPGAQRQWGHHATAFVGRRHFDDPDLIERRFERIDHPR
jgi:hypothetical protein